MTTELSRISLPDTKPSPFCRVSWNEKTQQFDRKNSYETIRCCLEKCRDHIQFCYNQCQGDAECNVLCQQLIDTCENGCYSIPSPAFDTIFDCLDSDEDVKKCGTFPLYDTDCLEQHREKILSCCDKNCTECEKEKTCSSMFNFVKDDYRSTFDDLKIENYKPRIERQTQRHSFLYTVIVVLFLFILVYSCWLSNKKLKTRT
jgi:hypothetical protein